MPDFTYRNLAPEQMDDLSIDDWRLETALIGAGVEHSTVLKSDFP